MTKAKSRRPEGVSLQEWRAQCLQRLLELVAELEALSERQAADTSREPLAPRGRGRPPKSELQAQIDDVLAERLRVGADYREACLLLDGEAATGLRGRITDEMADFMHRSPKVVEDLRGGSCRRRSRRKPG